MTTIEYNLEMVRIYSEIKNQQLQAINTNKTEEVK